MNLAGNSRKPIHAAVEEVRIDFTEDELAMHIAETNDQLNAYIDDELVHSNDSNLSIL